MKKYLLAIVAVVLFLGIAVWLLIPHTSVVVLENDVPVYGTDPLQHTFYVGSDDHFHHFQMQNGKRGYEAVVPVDAASIVPDTFPVDSGQRTFVTSSESGRIELFSAQIQVPDSLQQPERDTHNDTN